MTKKNWTTRTSVPNWLKRFEVGISAGSHQDIRQVNERFLTEWGNRHEMFEKFEHQYDKSPYDATHRYQLMAHSQAC
jgi:hypothetical protein